MPLSLRALQIKPVHVFWFGIAVRIVAPISVMATGYELYTEHRNQAFATRAAVYAERLEDNINAIHVLNRAIAIVSRDKLAAIEVTTIRPVLNGAMGEFPYLSHIRVAPANGPSLTIGKGDYEEVADEGLFEPDAVYHLDTQRSIEMKESLMVGPIKLHDGQVAIVLQTPMYTAPGPNHESLYLGQIQSVVPVKALLAESGYEDLTTRRWHYGIWKTDENSGERISLVDDGQETRGESYDFPVALPNTQWWVTIDDASTQLDFVVWPILILAAALISGVSVRRQYSDRQQLAALKKSARTHTEKMGRISQLLTLYQDVFDSVEAGMVVWNKDQVLESWNFGFERLYPGIAKVMVKGMTRRELRTLIENLGEITATHDWESLGTWFRQLPNGRMIMLKHAAMPDGGRLVMHTDMSMSLGDDDQ